MKNKKDKSSLLRKLFLPFSIAGTFIGIGLGHSYVNNPENYNLNQGIELIQDLNGDSIPEMVMNRDTLYSDFDVYNKDLKYGSLE